MGEVASFKIKGDLLRITSDGVSWDNKLINDRIGKPMEIRYGTKPIVLDMFIIGANYRLELRDKDKKKLVISLKSYFGIKSTQKFDLIQKVADSIWDEFFTYQFGEIIDNWRNGETIVIDNYLIDADGISRKKERIRFIEMQLITTPGHLVINSTKDSRRFMNVHYLEVWNWPLMHAILTEGAKR